MLLLLFQIVSELHTFVRLLLQFNENSIPRCLRVLHLFTSANSCFPFHNPNPFRLGTGKRLFDSRTYCKSIAQCVYSSTLMKILKFIYLCLTFWPVCFVDRIWPSILPSTSSISFCSFNSMTFLLILGTQTFTRY